MNYTMNEEQKKNRRVDLITPAVFLIYHPNIKRIWDERKLGYLLYLKLVSGKRIGRQTYISEAETLAIYNAYFGGN